ncbi:MAG: helix-turn-helix transcriptional regulator [Clostridia bacterium]|nr:helix-turn-helix transcriptional regulator [Clostridia bacterium]
MIKEKRKILGYTQTQMADLLNISLRQYVRIDTEEDLPRRDILKMLIKILDLSNEEIGIYIRSITKDVK